ncbi:MAG: hypothetical protein KGL39_45740 [Patescibacteria group bacterium]|nr:hypothetical protein [Patescibacteria group bacterium]
MSVIESSDSQAASVVSIGGEPVDITLVAGPTANAAQPANTAGAVVVKNAPGYLFSATVTTLGTAALTIYDNASAASGRVLLTIPASAAVGTIYQFYLGAYAANGITSGGVASCPAVTFQFT